ncbi:50S ribosomal protein L25 [Thalassospira lucentensis]|uniref:Large ribosomal subunit protein bL25 n=2 Tax=Thalassospira TaxID=168934 RepID=A0A154KQD6_9PROT|nr:MULTISPECIES: 50S ribosomal protein L25/general stress protein Ctc [Thalassospira]UKV13741.1 50S ribosomal protein L25/general stress protein Ctc [Thalassospiraceae bacterium SW-3-3]KZB51781.1 50S ribosomal protein L25 [Thalassospira xiamenensis]KZB69048.1 50S ribosomal protein L25 [Thalassospira lucentensis]MAZ34931.1 50S ribosomal protein L25 [Thalassospira sp.]MBO9506170.1 50S ribosomal protein L25/general stress protein Ctc [Thalassospira sp. A3_1]
MANTVITAEIRERAGKGAARAVRRAGMVPGVIYGAKQEPVLFQIDPRPLNKLLHKQGFFSHILDVKIGKETYEVLPRDVQFDKVTDAPIHVDFLRFAKGQTMTVEVPVRFVNEEKSPGLKKGGVLNIVRHDVEVECAPSAIPEELVFDLTGVEVGDSIHISAIKLPKGVELTITDRDFTVATVAAPSALKSEENAESDDEEEATEE